MRFVGIAAIGLWVVTIAVAGYFLVQGYTATGPDGRQVVLLNAEERDHVLGEMRGLLVATATIADALSRGDAAAIAKAASAAGMQKTDGEPPILLAKLPLDFKTAGFRIHAGFDTLASAATAGASMQKLTGMLAEQLTVCTGCHAAYSFPK